MSKEEEFYEAGHRDGCEDAYTVLCRIPIPEALGVSEAVAFEAALTYAKVEIRKMQGYTECPECQGSGERQTLTQKDILNSLFVALGGRTNLDRPCHTCWGERVVEKDNP